MAGYHRLTLLLSQGEGFARVLIFFRSVGLPLSNRSAASVGLPLILYYRIFGETLRYSFGVALVGVEIVSDRYRQIQRLICAIWNFSRLHESKGSHRLDVFRSIERLFRGNCAEPLH